MSKEDYGLSKRELEVLGLIAKGYSDKEIAIKLNITVHTANSHRKKMLAKLKARNAAMLVGEAFRKNLLK